MTMTVGQLIGTLRKRLAPGGTDPVVNLLKHSTGAAQVYDAETVAGAIDHMERKLLMAQMTGEKPNPLEQFAIAVLLRSAGVDLEAKPRRSKAAATPEAGEAPQV